MSATDGAVAADLPRLIEARRRELTELCRRFEVSLLELFGSAVRGDCDPGRSDLDFLVEFQARGKVGPADRYFALLTPQRR